jgi:hypothetical protein
VAVRLLSAVSTPPTTVSTATVTAPDAAEVRGPQPVGDGSAERVRRVRRHRRRHGRGVDRELLDAG